MLASLLSLTSSPGAFPAKLLLGPSEKIFIAQGVAQDIRADGRSRLEYRPFQVTLGPVPQALSSAKLGLGGTNILASVKADLVTVLPFEQPPALISCAVDCAPAFGMYLEDRQVAELGASLAGLLLAQLKASVNFEEQLAIASSSGQHRWSLSLDILVLEADGNLIDAISMASLAALHRVVLPQVSVEEGGETIELVVSNDPILSKALDCSMAALSVTFCLVEEGEGATEESNPFYIVDPSGKEEICTAAAIVLSIDPRGRIVCMKKLAAGSLSPTILLDMVQTGQLIASKLHGHLQEAFMSK